MGKERDYIIHDSYNIKGYFNEYRWLSNYHECPILWNGLGFSSTEAAYQSSKTVHIELAKKFQDYSPLISKQQGKLISIKKDWDKIKFNIMSQIVFQKFICSDKLSELLETGDKYLEETNHWNDVYWGVCGGIGQNNLGKIHMATREYLKFRNK